MKYVSKIIQEKFDERAHDEYPVTVAEYLWKFATPSSFSDNMSVFCVRIGLCDFAYYHLSKEGKILLAKLRLML